MRRALGSGPTAVLLNGISGILENQTTIEGKRTAYRSIPVVGSGMIFLAPTPPGASYAARRRPQVGDKRQNIVSSYGRVSTKKHFLGTVVTIDYYKKTEDAMKHPRCQWGLALV